MVIVIPLIVLAGLSVVGGYIGIPKVIGHIVGIPNYFENYLEPVFKLSTEYLAQHSGHGAEHHSVVLEFGLMGVSVLIALIGIAIAYTLYVSSTGLPAKFTATFPALHRAVYNKWYIDELYDFMIVNPCKSFGRFLWKGFDVLIVDGIVNGIANVVMGFSGVFRFMQSGMIHNYAFSMAFGVAVILGYYIFK